MKNIIFLIILLCITVAVFGESLKYDRVIVHNKGTENFGFDNTTMQNRSGSIIIKDDRVLIDFKKYKIKKQLSEHLFKIRGGTIEYVYNHETLKAVHITKFNAEYYYSIYAGQNILTAKAK